tara:strand:- start:230 stop:679 length:450 start_codon:yes stop_codon:yes gene_type:complete
LYLSKHLSQPKIFLHNLILHPSLTVVTIQAHLPFQQFSALLIFKQLNKRSAVLTMSAYIIAKIQIEDRETYAKYGEGFMPIFEKYQGELLTVDETPTVLEGSWPETRTVIARFKDKEAALKWYESEEYQELVQYRLQASTADVIITQGI